VTRAPRGYPSTVTSPQEPAPIDLSEVAAEPPAESVAHETEIVEQIVEDDPYADQPSVHPVEEQLQGLEDPEELRRQG
jgi:hypothetical protein